MPTSAELSAPLTRSNSHEGGRFIRVASLPSRAAGASGDASIHLRGFVDSLEIVSHPGLKAVLEGRHQQSCTAPRTLPCSQKAEKYLGGVHEIKS